MVIGWFAPKAIQRFQVLLNLLGNILFYALVVVVLLKMGPALEAVTPLLPVAALLLAAGSKAGILLFSFGGRARQGDICRLQRK